MTDPLRDAVHALRSTTRGNESGAGQYTRARVLATLRQKQRRRVVNVAFGIPLAALLIGSGAWASQQPLTHLVERISIALGLRSIPSVPSAPVLPLTRSPLGSAPAATQAPETNASSSTAEASTALDSMVTATASSTSMTTSEPSPRVETRRIAPSRSVENPASEQELLLYEQAHRAHFVERDPKAALAAWNEYLHSAPRGRFAIEAHYNRAVCLVRLGRHQQAKVALSPFAQGVHAGYRQTEARALIEQLERGSQ